MTAAKAASSAGDNSPDTDVSTSGGNASASATSSDGQGKSWTTSKSTETGGNTIVEKVFGRDATSKESDKDETSANTDGGDGGWHLISSSTSKKQDSEDASTTKSGSDNKIGGAFASSGKGSASAGIVDGKAVTSAH